MRSALKVGVLSTGFLLIGGSAAQAGDNWNTFANSGIGTGNQIKALVQAPIDICGNAVGVLGNSNAGCVGGASALMKMPSLTWSTWGNSGILSGNQAFVAAQAPIDACGNAIGILGGGNAWCQGGSDAKMLPESARTESTNFTSTGNSGVASGNQVYAPIQIPINICGIAVGILGPANAGCEGGASAKYSEGNGGVEANWTSSNNSGIGSGNQAAAIVQIPINVCGIAVGVLGNASAWCQGGSDATIGGDHAPMPGPAPYGHSPRSADAKAGHATIVAAKHGKKQGGKKGKNGSNESLGLDGLSGLLPLDAVTGLLGGGLTGGLVGDLTGGLTGKGLDGALSVGDVQSKPAAGKTASRHAGYSPSGSCDLNWNTSGNSGILTGNQIYVPAQIPVDVSGNAVGVLGNANASSQGGVSAVYC